MYSRIKYLAVAAAGTLIGTKETPPGSNRGFIIDKIESLFNQRGVQYCVIFVLYCYLEACNSIKVNFPFPFTASSQTLFENAYKLDCIYYDPAKIKEGDIVIWRKFNLWKGHAGLIISPLNKDNTFVTIEGNTSNTDYGSQRDGDGIYKRIRKANKINFTVSAFYIRGFIDVQKYFNIKGIK